MVPKGNKDKPVGGKPRTKPMQPMVLSKGKCLGKPLRGWNSLWATARSAMPWNARSLATNWSLKLHEQRWQWLSKPMKSHVGVGEFTTHVRTYLSGDRDVHWYGSLTHGVRKFAIWPSSGNAAGSRAVAPLKPQRLCCAWGPRPFSGPMGSKGAVLEMKKGERAILTCRRAESGNFIRYGTTSHTTKSGKCKANFCTTTRKEASRSEQLCLWRGQASPLSGYVRNSVALLRSQLCGIVGPNMSTVLLASV